MFKKVLHISLIAIMLLVTSGCLLMTYLWPQNSALPKRNYIICKPIGKAKIYPFTIAEPLGTQAIAIALKLFDHPEKIYIKPDQKWLLVSKETPIFHDIMMKV